MNSRTKTRLLIWLVVLGVFALGCVTGAFLDSAYRLQASSGSSGERRGAGGHRDKEDIFETMRRQLDLSEQQTIEIGAILDQTRNEYRALRAEVRPRYDVLRQNARARMRTLLSTDQQRRFDALVAERDALREEDDKNGRGGLCSVRGSVVRLAGSGLMEA